ncbi:MAG: S-adenosylmethionine:tRNA ribosyltransferase-isomerase, partial [Pseudomonadota bacterium]|nr:S-adenosylmethionine:tRNA ribosyltransferase-isomerase [Pseudomonadota bacterium]
EDRPLPPLLRARDRLRLGPLRAVVGRALGHPRLVELRFVGSADAIWAGLARHGRPIQFAHVQQRLALWDVWSQIAASPVAFEPASASFALDWHMLGRLRERGVGFATLTHAAGLSSTGDAELDSRLPFDEPYHLPQNTVAAIAKARCGGGRVVALGTTVTRALEHAAARPGGLVPGFGLADQRLGQSSRLRVVDALVSGVHESGTSHHALLGAFVPSDRLAAIDAELSVLGYRSHEFGESVLIEASAGPLARLGTRLTGQP